jgi:hypothetical protein
MGFYFVNPNLLLVVGLKHHGPFANYQEFLIPLLFLVSSAFKDKNNPFFFAQLGDVSSMERSPSIVVSYLVCEDMSNQIPSKKRKLYDSSRKFQDAWTTRLNGQNLLLMKRGWCNTLHARFAHLLKGKKNCLHESWIAYLSIWVSKRYGFYARCGC